MAYNRKRIDPLDLQPSKAIGVSFPFKGAGVFTSTYTSQEAIKMNLLNYFLTSKRERVMNTSFGSGLRDLLFENITNTRLAEVKSVILEEIEIYFPRVVVKYLDLTATPDTGTVTFSMNYAISETNITDNLSINIEV